MNRRTCEWLFCGGMRRSGSTLQFQMAAAIVEEAGLGRRLEWRRPEDFPDLQAEYADDHALKVFKTHRCTDTIRGCVLSERGRAVYCYRDVRDAVASKMRLNQRGLEAFLRTGFIEEAVEHYRRWHELPDLYSVKYEVMIAHPAEEVARLAAFLGADLDAAACQRIAEAHSLDEQRNRIVQAEQRHTAGDDTARAFDAHSLLHRGHITSNGPP